MNAQKTNRRYYTANPTLLATYDNIFPNNAKENIKDLLINIKQDDVFSFCAYINSKFNSPNYQEWEFDFVNKLITELDETETIKEEIIKHFNQLVETNNQHPIVFNIINSMQLMQYAIFNMSNIVDNLSLNVDLQILKVFLLLNEDYIRRTNGLIKNTDELTNKERYLKALIPMYMINSEFFILKDPTIQSIKFKKLYDYINSHIRYNELSIEFLKSFGVDSWNQYLRYIFKLYTFFHETKDGYSTEQLSYKIKFSSLDDNFRAFCSNFVFNLNRDKIEVKNNIDLQDNFLLRKYPFFLDSDGYLIITNINFLADHIFQAVYFKFKDLVKSNFGAKEATDFKSIYSFEFSQNVLFKDVINNCFKNNFDIIQHHNKELDSEYSDCYLRKNKRIYLFEFKDYLLSKELKYSLDFYRISDFLIDRFVNEAGIIQLLKVIANIEQGGFEFDKSKDLEYFKNGKIVIQPIIVYSDFALNCDGINFLLNEQFHNKLKEANFKLKINDIIMIHIDLLLRYEDEFQSKNINFNDLLNRYNAFRARIRNNSSKDDLVDPNEFIAFEQFFYRYINQKQKSCEVSNSFKEISKVLTR